MAPISFARGAPSLDIVDVEGLREAAQIAFDKDPGGTVAYGTSVGYVPLREWIAEQHGVAVEQVLVTNGSMQADAFLFELLVRPGRPRRRRVADLRPHAAQPAQPRGRRPHGRPRDGRDRRRRRALAAGDGGAPEARAHHPQLPEPRGLHAAARSATELLALAAEYDFTIFEDDPYVAIRFEGEALRTMRERDDAGKVVYASSFSKTVCPGIRVGYLVGPQAVIKQIQGIATNTYISPNMVAQSIVNQFARSGRMDGAIATVKDALRERRDTLVAALERELPEARFTPPSGGYFMWVELPEGADVAALETAAKERDVLFVKGTDFLLEGGGNTLRLAYSGVTPEQIDEGITRLAEAARSLGVAA